MAKFSHDGVDDLINAMQQADLFDEETQTELLQAGTEQFRKIVREEAGRSPHNLKFVLSKLSKQKRAKRDRDGNYYMTVSVTGKNERGERNASVAFVLNYGRREEYGKIAGSHFWTRAARRSDKSVVPIYEKIIGAKYKERGLI